VCSKIVIGLPPISVSPGLDSGQHPQTTEAIITWSEDTVAAWNEDLTPFVWGGKRKERRDRARQRRLGGSPAVVSVPQSNAA